MHSMLVILNYMISVLLFFRLLFMCALKRSNRHFATNSTHITFLTQYKQNFDYDGIGMCIQSHVCGVKANLNPRDFNGEIQILLTTPQKLSADYCFIGKKTFFLVDFYSSSLLFLEHHFV